MKCTHCTACCRNVARMGLEEDETGLCVHHDGSTCTIYDSRPAVCRTPKWVPQFVNTWACNRLMDKMNIDPKYRIK